VHFLSKTENFLGFNDKTTYTVSMGNSKNMVIEKNMKWEEHYFIAFQIIFLAAPQVIL